MELNAVKIVANTFQFFTRNPRGSKAKDIDPEDVEKSNDIMKENNFDQILAHVPYTLNPESDKVNIGKFAGLIIEDDLKNIEYFPNNLYNFHPGSHVGQGVDKGIEFIIKLLNEILKPEYKTTVLLETMAGKGTEIGHNFEEMKKIIDGVELYEKLGVCLDTYHVYDAGYDIVNDLDGVLDEFDRVIGLNKLYAVHINDSKIPIIAIRIGIKGWEMGHCG
jgi:deoxyribonuclease-4